MNINHLRQWVGKNQNISDVIDLATCQRMEATLDRSPVLGEGDDLPPLWHWLYFHQPAMQSTLGRDGHAEKGGFLPPVALPRRMWAGGRFEFFTPLPIGVKVQKLSTIKSVETKTGRSGNLCFVTVQHQLNCEGVVCVCEEHDIVYRDDPKPDEKPSEPPNADNNPDWSKTVTPSPELLFRYSALTFNSHKIHYDRDYCRDVEGYPGLVFHGPLTATLLLDFAISKAGGRIIKQYDYRAISPAFDISSFDLFGWDNGEAIKLQAVNSDGGIIMKASVEFK